MILQFEINYSSFFCSGCSYLLCIFIFFKANLHLLQFFGVLPLVAHILYLWIFSKFDCPSCGPPLDPLPSDSTCTDIAQQLQPTFSTNLWSILRQLVLGPKCCKISPLSEHLTVSSIFFVFHTSYPSQNIQPRWPASDLQSASKCFYFLIGWPPYETDSIVIMVFCSP